MYVHRCACSQGVSEAVKSEGAGIQTIGNLGIKRQQPYTLFLPIVRAVVTMQTNLTRLLPKYT